MNSLQLVLGTLREVPRIRTSYSASTFGAKPSPSIALDDARAAIDHAIDGHRTPGLYGWTMELELRFASMGEHRPTVRTIADWARKHVGHDVRPRSEYGDIDGQCNQHWLCGSCATRHLCTKVLGHVGEHGRP